MSKIENDSPEPRPLPSWERRCLAIEEKLNLHLIDYAILKTQFAPVRRICDGAGMIIVSIIIYAFWSLVKK